MKKLREKIMLRWRGWKYKSVFSPWRLRAMMPRIRRLGWRYYFDQGFRNRVRRKEYAKMVGRSFIVRRKKIKQKLFIAQNYRCNICRKTKSFNDFTIDHIKQVRIGGSSKMSNLQLLCRPCHEKKDYPGRWGDGVPVVEPPIIEPERVSKMKPTSKAAKRILKRRANIAPNYRELVKEVAKLNERRMTRRWYDPSRYIIGKNKYEHNITSSTGVPTGRLVSNSRGKGQEARDRILEGVSESPSDPGGNN